MHELTARRATVKDAALLAGIMNEGAARKRELNDTIWGDEPYTKQETKDLIEHHPTYLVYRGDELVGTVTLQWEDEAVWGKTQLDAGYVHRLVVKNSLHGQGLGEQIMEWAAHEAAKNDRQFLRLDCDLNNKGLCAYYEKLGFTLTGTGTKDESDGYIPALYQKAV